MSAETQSLGARVVCAVPLEPYDLARSSPVTLQVKSISNITQLAVYNVAETLYFTVMKPATVYALRLPGGDVRYVGQTTETLQQRLSRHHHRANSGGDLPVHRWLRKHSNVEIVELINDAIWNEDEIRVIAELRSRGAQLLNCTDGGEGRLGWKMTVAQKRLLSTKLKGKAQHRTSRREHSLETRAKLSEASKAAMTPEVRAKISQANAGRVPWNKGRAGLPGVEPWNKAKQTGPLTDERRARISQAMAGRTLSASHKAKLSLPQAVVDQVVELRRSGLTLAAIAKECGIGTSSVSRILREAGLVKERK